MSLSARSIVLIAALLHSAGATTITILSADNIAEATADRNSWLTENFGGGTTPEPVHVDVDNLTPGKSEVEILQLLTTFHSLYFFMTGVQGNVQIRTADGTSAHLHKGDDGLYFVGITSATSLESIQWRSHDGLALYGFGIPQHPAATPEPASWLCLATGLAAIRRRSKVPSSPSPAAPWIWR